LELIGCTTRDPENQHAINSIVGGWIEIKAVFYDLADG